MSRATLARRSVVAFALILGTVALFATPAFAHATIQSTDPAASTAFAAGSPPRAVTLRFDESVTVSRDSVQVFDRSGKLVRIGTVGRGRTASEVHATLPRLPNGTYVVTWRVVSDDSHPVQGAFTFGVGVAAGSSADAQSLLAQRTGDRTVGILFGFDRALAFFAVLVLVGGLAFVRWAWPAAGTRRDVTRLLGLALAVTIVSALAGIALQAAYSSGGGLSTVADGSQLRAVLHTKFGHAWVARIVLAVLCVALARLRPGRAGVTRVASDVLFGAAALAVLGTFTYAGHGDSGRFVALGAVTDLAHLTGAAVWLGGLCVLAVALRDPEQPAGATLATQRFSAIALPAIVLVALSGTVQAWRQVGTWWALWHTTYARLLVVKVTVVLALVVVAYASRDVLRFRIAPRLRAALGPGAARREADPGDVRELRDGIWVEVVIAVVIVAVTAVLVNTQPAREAAAAVPRTFDATLAAPGARFRVVMQPAQPGDNTVVVTPRLGAGAPPLLQLDATMALPGRVARIPIAFAPLGDGRYVATVQVPFAGKWTLQLRALRTQTDESDAQTTVPVG